MTKNTRILHIDLETYSEIDIRDCGVYRYVDDDSFEILLFAYGYDEEPVKVIDLAQGEEIPESILQDLTDPKVIKKAHNANFERTCLAKHTGQDMDPHQWQCSAVRASQLGLPRSLAAVGDALGIPEEEKKMKIGAALITYFCKPCKPTKANGGRTRNLPKHAPEKWELFKAYNIQDVETERYIDEVMQKYPAETQAEHELWCLDQRINEKGVKVELTMIENILAYNENYRERLISESKEISKLENPNSLVQIKGWLKARGIDVTTLNKDDTTGLVKELSPDDKNADIVKFLKIRQELGKTSVSKYEAMARSVCHDGRIRGMLQFYGANRTGRWAGRIVQLQNLPQNHLDEIEETRQYILNDELDLIETFYSSVMDTLSQLIRTAFIAEEKKTFVVCDYSAIEARVLGWLAGEEWVMETFRTTGKIYEATAAQMYNVPITAVTHGSDLRKKGKIATLACGYGGGVGALSAMDRKGEIPEEEKQGIINDWRKANPKIVKFWEDVEASAITAVSYPGTTLKLAHGIEFQQIHDTLFVKLPNGRRIAYNGARVEDITKYGRTTKALTYMGQDQQTQKWVRLSTYGGKMVENITQATARDCLGTAMLHLQEAGYVPGFHVHDEVIIEVPASTAEADIEKIKDIMALKDEWTDGLILKAEGYITPFYKKD